MKILLTNDDGYRAEPYQLLGRELQKVHDVTMISPEENCSGISHAFTLTKPVFLRPMKKHENALGLHNFYAFSGTPADCVKFSLVEYFKEDPPDLVLSGINHGANVGVDVLYSGTVAAAVEAAINGVSGVALSHFAYDIPERRIPEIAQWVLGFLEQAEGWLKDKNRVVNVNYPDRDASDIAGTRVTRTAEKGFTNTYDQRLSPHSKPYYWLHGKMILDGEAADSDKVLAHSGFISVTPLQFDFTSHEEMEDLKSLGF